MDQMRGLRENDLVVDIENGEVELFRDGHLGSNHSERPSDKVCDGFPGNVGCGGSNSTLVSVSIENPVVDKFVGVEENAVGNLEKNRHKKKNCKKPPKPPRPPKAPSLDEADQKLIREIAELAMLRRARIERMKALKKTKNSKVGSSNVNIWAFLITALFCLVVFWQGFFSKSASELGFEGSPVSSSLVNSGGLISVQYYHNSPSAEASLSSSESPNIVEQVSGSDAQDEPSILNRLSR